MNPRIKPQVIEMRLDKFYKFFMIPPWTYNVIMSLLKMNCNIYAQV